MDQQTKTEEPKKRLKLNELPVSPGAMKRFQQLIIERITNLGIVMRGGTSPTQALMAEICVLESKVDALMQILESKHNIDFTEFNEYLENAAASGAASAVNIRQQMQGR